MTQSTVNHSEPLRIYFKGEPLVEVDMLLMIPKDAPDYPDKVIAHVSGSPANAKHAYHAISQIALLDFEEELLTEEEFPNGESLEVKQGDCFEELTEGIIIARDKSGKVRLFAHDTVDTMRLLRFANRYCTRWIRLDI